MKIVFFGDSITDGGRDRADEKSLGGGYVKIIADKLRLLYPGIGLEIINKGISGDEVGDLLSRIERDVLDLKPSAVVLMIGINNVIHEFKTGKKFDFQLFEKDLSNLLGALKNSGIYVIFLQPFLLPAPEAEKMQGLFNRELEIVNKIGLGLSDEFIALNEIFNGLTETIPYNVYTIDGVHPTYNGAMLIADLTIKAIRKRFV